MYKTMGLQQRREDLTHQQYVDHWLNVHAPMSEGVEDLTGYVSNEVIASDADLAVSRSCPAFGSQLDGIAQLHFAEEDSLMTMAQRPEVKAWFEDGPNFVGLRTGFIAREEVIKTPQRDGRSYKAFCFLNKVSVAVPAKLRAFAENEPGLIIDHLGQPTGSTNLAGFEVPDITMAIELWAESVASADLAAKRLQQALEGDAELVAVVVTLERVIKMPDQTTA